MKRILDQFEEYLVKTGNKGSKNYKKYPRYVSTAVGIVKDGDRYFDIIVASSYLPERLLACDGLISGIEALIDDTSYTGSKGTLKSYKTAMRAFRRFLESSSGFIPMSGTKKSPSTKGKKTVKKATRKILSPCLGVELGADDDTVNVRYLNELMSGGFSKCVPVPMDKRVPELAEFIEYIYPKILDFAKTVFYLPEEAFRKIPVFLSTDCPVDAWRKNDEYLVREVKELLMNSDGVTTEDIRNILDDPYFYDRRIGEFKHINTDPHIVIYYMNFNTSDRNEFFAMVANLLSHEYMHYLQYTHCCDRGVSNPFRGKYATTVSEAMAEFFAELFSVSLGGAPDICVAERRYNTWIKREGSGWPYAAALCFHRVGGRDIRFSPNLNDYFDGGNVYKLCRVFDMSMRSVYAYDLMKNL